MAIEWYYSKAGQQQGPVSTQQLQRLLATGQLQPTDPVWKQGMAGWTPANQIQGLIPSSAPSTAPQPPAAPQPQPFTPVQERTPSVASRYRRRRAGSGTAGWKIPIFAGAGLLCCALFVPWWGITVTEPPRPPKQPDLSSISDPNVRRPLPNLLRLALGVRCSALGVRHLNAQRRGCKPKALVALAVQPHRCGKKETHGDSLLKVPDD